MHSIELLKRYFEITARSVSGANNDKKTRAVPSYEDTKISYAQTGPKKIKKMATTVASSYGRAYDTDNKRKIREPKLSNVGPG